jgi:hypothetical protein
MAPAREPATLHSTDADDAIGHLDALAAELLAHGWDAQVRRLPGRPPSLHARNPVRGAGALSEDIYTKPGQDGSWGYWWPWGEPIARDPASAAAVIVCVLRPQDSS